MADGKRRIGISGGTFDPIHYGHLIIAEEIRESLSLDKIVFIPVGLTPHKKVGHVTEACHRYNMVCEAISTNPFFEVSRIEMDREGYTYTIDTLRQLKEIYGDDTELFFIIGADVLFDLATWKDYEQVFSMCDFVAVSRPGYKRSEIAREVKRLEKKFNARIHLADARLIEISSTLIRENVKKGKSIKYLVPEAVERYIYEKGLYR